MSVKQQSHLKALVCLFVFGATISSFGDDEFVEPRPIPQEIFMRIKLRSSAKVLEGIVTQDFDLVDAAAKDMEAMSEASRWPKADDRRYEHYGIEFRRLCQKMSQMAEEKNLEGVVNTHFQITNSCVRCHEYVHDSLRTAPDPTGPFQLIPNAPVGEN